MARPDSPIIVALDALSEPEALALARALQGLVWGYKVNDLLLASGVGVITRLAAYGRVFADPKLHDIPNTVANQVRHLARAGAQLVTLHGSGGPEMLRAAKLAVAQEAADRGAGASTTQLLAVTVLTSTSPELCQDTYGLPPEDAVAKLAGWALEAGLDGIVCSPQELALMNRVDGVHRLLRVTPGIRPGGYGKADDQKRTQTPAVALAGGADLLVVGRPITEAQDPAQACRDLLAEIRA